MFPRFLKSCHSYKPTAFRYFRHFRNKHSPAWNFNHHSRNYSQIPPYELSNSNGTQTYSSFTPDPNANTAKPSGSTEQPDPADFALRNRVLELSLNYVVHYGWTTESIERACRESDLPAGLHTMVAPQGGIDIVLYFCDSRNQKLSSAMMEWRKSEGSAPSADGLFPPFPSSQETDAFLHRALKHRLEMIVPVRSVWPQAMGLLAYPQNMTSSIGVLAQLVDEIWAVAGDRSTDMSWYAKRLGLAYTYSLTELYLLQDDSPDFVNSWNFLETRISELRSLKRMDLKAVSSLVREGLCAFGNVTSNVLGLSKR